MLLDLYADRRSTAPDMPLAEVPVAWQERLAADWEAQKLRGWHGLQELAPYRAYEAATEAFRRAGLQPPENPFAIIAGDDSLTGRAAGALGLRTRRAAVEAWREAARLARERNPEFADEFPDPFDIEQSAQARARTAQEEADRAARASEGTIADVAGFAARMGAAVLTDPIQLMSLPLGAPGALAGGFAARLLKAGLVEGAVGGAAQAVTTTLNRPAQQAAGITPDPWTDILYAAGGSAVLGGGLRGVVEGFRVLRGLDPADGAVSVARAVEMHEAGNPGGLATAQHHTDTMNRAMADVAAGRMPSVENRPPAEPEPVAYAGRPAPPTEGARVFTASGRAVAVRYELAELDDLIPSHSPAGRINQAYPHAEGLQPRDRTRPAEIAAVRERARGLNPELLGPSVDAGTGAPVIGPDNVVESGNGRVLAMLIARGEIPARWGAYRSWLESQGFDLSAYRAPVLVARREGALTGSERVAFAQEANVSQVNRMSLAEQAMTDARRLDAIIGLHRGGDITKLENIDFVRGFVAGMPSAERGAIAAADGTLSTEGARRMRAAILARAYGDRTGLLERLLENPDSDIKAIGGALDDVAPIWAQMRALDAEGVLAPGSDRTAELLQAVRTVETARAKRITVADWVAQGGMFDDGLNDTALAFLASFHREPQFRGTAGRATIAERLEDYARAQIATQQRSMFDAGPVPPRAEAPQPAAPVAPNVRAARAAAAADAARAPEIDADRALFIDAQRAAAADDRLVPSVDADGAERMVSARQLLDEAEDAEALAGEAAACLLGMTTGAAT